jgi:hypothetical protein
MGLDKLAMRAGLLATIHGWGPWGVWQPSRHSVIAPSLGYFDSACPLPLSHEVWSAAIQIPRIRAVYVPRVSAIYTVNVLPCPGMLFTSIAPAASVTIV